MFRKQALSKIKDMKTLPCSSITTSCVGWNEGLFISRRKGQLNPRHKSNLQFARTLVTSTCLSTKSHYENYTSSTEANQRGSGNRQSESKENFPNHWGVKAAGLTSAAILGYYLFDIKTKYSPLLAASPSNQKLKNSQVKTYTKSEVSQHYNEEKRIWVTFKNGVYDITDFVGKHPGGNKIMMAAGSSLEPFWELYPVHKRTDIFQILEKYRIGNLSEDEIIPENSQHKTEDAFSHEPIRHSVLIPRSVKPCNAETPPNLLSANLYTPNEIFYVRNHLPVPKINIADYELEVEGLELAREGKTFTLNDIKKLPKVEISATIQCGGNRRSDMSKTKQAAGLAWGGGAIGNAKWAGARLVDVLKAAGFRPENYKSPEKVFIQFEGLDRDQSGDSYGASIPLSYILDQNFEGIIAYEMNGETLPLDHGYPIRVVVPGIVGARCVKWLSRIVVSDEESQSPWQQRDYKVFSPSVTLETVDYSSAPPIMDTPVNSYICSHDDGDVISKGSNSIQGYAFSGGGRDIIRVEISTDKGKTWTVAQTMKSTKKTFTRNWSWTLWETVLEFPETGNQEIWVKAVDSGYNQQPEDFKSIWNYRGLLSNAFHKIQVKVIE